MIHLLVYFHSNILWFPKNIPDLHFLLFLFFDSGGNGEFQNGLFDCCGDCGACCKASCCPCLVAKSVGDHTGDSGTLWCLGYLAGLAIGGLVSFSWLLSEGYRMSHGMTQIQNLFQPMFLCVCYQRGMLRTHQGIEGGVCGDLIGSYLCPCCVLTQMERETKD